MLRSVIFYVAVAPHIYDNSFYGLQLDGSFLSNLIIVELYRKLPRGTIVTIIRLTTSNNNYI